MKKGFTLIELLAVIVILAIIALIATPIILNIIKDAKEESQERSIELYANAAKNAVAKYQLNNTTAPTSFDQLDIEYDGNVACITEELYGDGSIYLAGCTVNGDAVEYTYGTQQEVLAKFTDVCTPVTTATTGTVPTGAYNIGDEYTCEVKEGTSYTFFVLSKEDNKVNLIMDSNIRADGTPVKDTTDLGLVAWLSEASYAEAGGVVTDEMLNDEGPCQYGRVCVLNTYGPLTAMAHLKEATSSWTKTGKLVTSTFDDYAGVTHEMAQTISAGARMPYLSEVNVAGCTTSSGSCTLWMTNYLEPYTSKYADRTAVSGVYGYWTLSSGDDYPDLAWGVYYGGSTSDGTFGYVSGSVNSDGYLGVRPVITLSI